MYRRRPALPRTLFAEPMPTPSHTDSRPPIIVIGFLATYVLAIWDTSSYLWSLDAMKHAAWAKWVFVSGVVLIGAAVFVPGVRALVSRIGRCLTTSALWASAAFLVLCVCAPVAHTLLGDGDLLVRELDAGAWDRLLRTDRAPLTFWLLVQAHELIGTIGGDATDVYRLLSVLSGLAYVVLCPRVASSLSDDARGERLIAGILLSTGYLVLFFGYVENYAPLYPGGLLLVLLLSRTIDEKMPLWPSAVTLAILSSLHFSAAFLAPGLLYAGYVVSRVQGVRSAAAQLVVFPAAALLILWSIGFDTVAYVAEIRGHTLPLTGALGYHAAYHLVSIPHLIDLANAVLLAAPGAVLLLLCVPVSALIRDRTSRLLAALCVGPLWFVAIANPEIGAFRDWDVLALPTLPLCCLAAYAWSERIPSPRSVILILGATTLHTALWIGLNTDVDASVRRYGYLMTSSSLSTHGQVYGWETLGAHYREQGKHTDAAAAYERALAANPSHARLWLMLGNARQQEGRLDAAEDAYRQAVRLNPDSAEGYSNLGVVQVRRGQYTAALSSLERSIEQSPRYPEAWMNRGVALANLGRTDEAIESLRQATRIDPGYSNAYANLSRLFAAHGSQDSARHYAAKAAEAGAP